MATSDEILPNTWVDDFINSVSDVVTKRGGKVQLNISGANVEIAIEAGLLSFLIANRSQLVVVGLDAFKQFLGLLTAKQDFKALELIYSQFDNTTLIANYRQDSVALAEIAAQTQANRDFWIMFAQQAAERTVFAALGALLP